MLSLANRLGHQVVKRNISLTNTSLFTKGSKAVVTPVTPPTLTTYYKYLSMSSLSSLPSVDLLQGFPDPKTINLDDYCAGKNVILVGLPGAFTPT